MNKKTSFLVLALCTLIVLIAGLRLYPGQSQEKPNVQAPTPNGISVSTVTPTQEEFTASFEIYTQGTKRIFTAAMYHNKSPNAYIENPDPSVVHVTKPGITWVDFFETLPFTLTKECLVTGTGQTFCNSATEKLHFFLNGTESSDALDLRIQPGDALRVTYGN